MSTGALIILIALAVFLILYLLARPEGLQRRTGKVLGFVGFLVLPILAVALGAGSHLEHSKTTQFCLSCHEMQPYGETLFIDDAEYLPASHYQNKRMPRDLACFSCHTDYTMYGDVNAKLRGLRHLWVHYLGTIPEEIELYTPFQNRECLHCHGGARSFDESDFHIGMEEDLASGEVSCLDCHSFVHPVEEVADLPKWEPQEDNPHQVNQEAGGKP
jgi:cytochrome c-type protein NapC